MAEQRLIDANNLGVGKANPDAFERKDYAYGWNSALQAVTEASPTIDPESLPIVRQLREENKNLKQAFGDTFACDLMDKLRKAENELARVTAERDALRMNPPVEIQTDAFALAVDLAQVTAERDAAVEQLHGFCPACQNYTANHCEGPCELCEHEYYKYRDSNARDNWEWRGPQKEE